MNIPKEEERDSHIKVMKVIQLPDTEGFPLQKMVLNIYLVFISSNKDVMLNLVRWFAAYIIFALWGDFIYQNSKGDPVTVL